MLLAAEPFEKNDFFQAAVTPSFLNITTQKKFWIVPYYTYNRIMKTEFEYHYSF